MHQRLGAVCGATPDGRIAGFPFADGAGPAQGREKNGPTAALLSVCSWSHFGLLGGTAFNQRYSTTAVSTPEARKKLEILIDIFIRQGGFETQINILDAETLKKAQLCPEEYKDLIVRIGGYTDYFTGLSIQMQKEVIQRTVYQNL
jgi:formate C-acetyltransferase